MVALANPSSSSSSSPPPDEPRPNSSKNEDNNTVDTISYYSGSSDDESERGAVVLREENDQFSPTFGNISVTQSKDVHFGPKTVYQAPVTIKQFVYANGSADNKIQLDPSAFPGGIDNTGFTGDVTNKLNNDSGVVKSANNTEENKHNCFVKGLQWFHNQSKKNLSIVISVSIVIVSLTVLAGVLLIKHNTDNPPINPGYLIPDAHVKILDPKGFTVSIPDKDDVRLFSFHGSVNKRMNQKEAGQFSVDVISPSGGSFTYFNDYAAFNCGDVIYFWTHVEVGPQHSGYDRFNQQYNITATDCLKVKVDVGSTAFNVSISAIQEWIKSFTFQGKINKALQFPEQGDFGGTITTAESDKWSYNQNNFTIKCNDTLNYWVKVEFNKKSGRKDIHKNIVYHKTDCEYKIPTPLIEVLKTGFRVSIPDEEGIKLFAFHGKLNKPIAFREGGDFSRDVNSPSNGRWFFEDNSTKLSVGDVLNYWVYVIHSGKGYERHNQTFTVQDKFSINIIKRKEWGANPPSQELEKLATPVPMVVIHHTESPNCFSFDECSSTIRSIQDYQMHTKQWFDIGHNFLIGGDGTIYEGRGWETIGAHTKHLNNISVGFAMIGTFAKSLPTELQIKACQDLIKYGVEKRFVDGNYKLYGASQLRPTESPGAAFYEELKKWPHWTSNTEIIKPHDKSIL